MMQTPTSPQEMLTIQSSHLPVSLDGNCTDGSNPFNITNGDLSQ